MRIVGLLPPDAPDPRIAAEARLQQIAFPVLGLEPQPALEDYGDIGFEESTGPSGLHELTVGLSYLLRRDPAHPDDPINLVDPEDASRPELMVDPAWPRPEWLVRMTERMRYPHLWEAVWTTWTRDRVGAADLPARLVHHANHVLMNRFHEELGVPFGAFDDPSWKVKESAVNPAVAITVDGVRFAASEIDTDPFVYAVGVTLDDARVATVVVPRDELPYVRLALHTRHRPAGR